MGRVTENHRKRSQSALLGQRTFHQYQRGSPVRNGACVRCGDRSVASKRGLEQRYLFGRRLERLLILVDDGVAFFATHSDRRDFPPEGSIVSRRQGARQRTPGELVLLLTGEAEGVGALLGEHPHQLALVVG